MWLLIVLIKWCYMNVEGSPGKSLLVYLETIAYSIEHLWGCFTHKNLKNICFSSFVLKSFYLICTYSYYMSDYIDSQTHLKRIAMILKDTLICGHNIWWQAVWCSLCSKNIMNLCLKLIWSLTQSIFLVGFGTMGTSLS